MPGIKRTFLTDLINGKAKNGYIKICDVWIKRLWGQVKLDVAEKNGREFDNAVNNNTNLFDSCGAYDGSGNDVDKASVYEPWGTALDFIESFGAPKMDGFGYIIVEKSDDEESEDFFACYDQATKLFTSTILAITALIQIYQ